MSDPQERVTGLERDGLLGRLRRERDVYAGALSEMTVRYEQKIQELSLLRRTSDALRDCIELDEVFRRFLGIVREELGETACSLYLADETGQLCLRARCSARGLIQLLLPAQAGAIRVPPDAGPIGRSFVTGEIRLLTEAPEGTAGWFPEGERTVLAAPLGPRQACTGVLTLHARSSDDLPDDAERLLPILATQATVALENAILYRRLKQHSDTLESRVRERTAALEHLNRELQAAAQQKAQFYAHFSHELRTPLNSILGFSEMLQAEMQGTLTEPQRRYVRHIHDSGGRLLRLINDILDLAKVEAGRLSLQMQPARLAPLVEQALAVMLPQARVKQLELAAALPPDLPLVLADPTRVHQILLNLLSNAVKFTREGGQVTVSAECLGAEPADGAPGPARMVRVAVTDTGVGIAEADQDELFRDFGQVADGRYQGTGLGLSLSRRLVRLHGGEIGVQSRLGAGSTFWFSLPLDQPPAAGESGVETHARPAS